MPIINSVLVMEDADTGLKMFLDLKLGTCTVTDNKAVAFGGKFQKSQTKQLLKNVATPKRKPAK